MGGSFDLVVIGGGPGGYVAALRAAQLGARTAIVEKDRMGGTCLVRGCIPTKALLQSSELYTQARDGAAFGVVADKLSFDWPVAQKRKTAVVDQLVKGVEGLLKAGGVTSLRGNARLAGKGVVDVSGDQLQAKDIIIATGSAIAPIALPGAELTIDSDQILELKEVPRRLAVIGGGVVGMEFAAMFAALGSKVTVLEMLPQVLAMVDSDLVAVYAKHLAKLGGEIHTDSKVSEVAKRNGALQVRFSTGGEGGAVDADQVLLAVGRVPYTQGLDAEKAGVKLERGRVVVDDHLRTTADGVWAIGDVIGGIMLAHVASYEGVCAVENIAGHTDRVPDYHAAPNCVYTDPEIAHVGLGEKEAKDKGIAVKIGRFPFAAAGRALQRDIDVHDDDARLRSGRRNDHRALILLRRRGFRRTTRTSTSTIRTASPASTRSRCRSSSPASTRPASDATSLARSSCRARSCRPRVRMRRRLRSGAAPRGADGGQAPACPTSRQREERSVDRHYES